MEEEDKRITTPTVKKKKLETGFKVYCGFQNFEINDVGHIKSLLATLCEIETRKLFQDRLVKYAP